MMAKKLTKSDKIHLVANSTEVTTAIKMLAAVMLEAGIKNFIQYEYEIDADAEWGGAGKYRFKFQKLHTKKKK